MSRHHTRVRGWVGAGMAEAAVRLLILTATTAVLAHLLEPSQFGIAALAFSVASIFAVFVSAPYEEALAQRRALRRVHVGAALAASLASALALVAASVPLGALLDLAYGPQGFLVLMPASGLMLLGQGPLAVATALARRRRRFYAINVAAMAGHAAGAALAVGIAAAGGGIWALVALRVGIVLANAAVLMAMLGLAVMPRWDRRTVGEIAAYGKFVLMTRLVDNATLLVYNLAVGSFFGITVLGYANMAMRLIEPVRGAMVAITHNLSFSYFASLGGAPGRLGESARRISDESAVTIAPVFMGLAAVSPVLVPLMAGPGWGDTAPIAAMLALGGMVALPAQVVQSAQMVAGRPQQVLHANLAGLAAMALVLVATVGMDPVLVGAARAVGDLVQTLVTVALGGLILLPRRRLMRELAGTWCMAAAMALAVAAAGARLALALPLFAVLPLAVGIGVVLYGLMLFAFARPSFDRLAPMLLARVRPPAHPAAAE